MIATARPSIPYTEAWRDEEYALNCADDTRGRLLWEVTPARLEKLVLSLQSWIEAIVWNGESGV